MPELPEVETITREIRGLLIGDTIQNYKIYWHKTFQKLCDKKLQDQTIRDVGRKGKYIILYLENAYLLIHLRMTGRLVVNNNSHNSDKHLRISFQLGSQRNLNFYDVRKFGRIYFTDKHESVLARTGIDALSEDLTENKFVQLIKTKKGRIKSVLLDQRVISGLGNIYCDESLFRAQIHPARSCFRISEKRLKKLYHEIKKVLDTAIQNLGTTLVNYRTVAGGFGDNQNYLRVYGRKNKKCYICGNTIQKILINNRGTHYCPRCQK